jgi:hypothetical protein
MLPTCSRCHRPAAFEVTGANFARPAPACDQHVDAAQKAAGIPRTTTPLTDDGVDTLFDLPGGDR